MRKMLQNSLEATNSQLGKQSLRKLVTLRPGAEEREEWCKAIVSQQETLFPLKMKNGVSKRLYGRVRILTSACWIQRPVMEIVINNRWGAKSTWKLA